MKKYTPADLPSVEVVYPLALAAYDTAVKRFDSLDGKLNTLLTLAVTISLVVPVAANAKHVSFHSKWFVAAALAFVSGIAIATVARLSGALMLLDPKVIYDSYLDCDPWDFKRRTIYWSGEHFRHNQKLINRNGTLAAVAAILFALEVVLVGVWVLSLS